MLNIDDLKTAARDRVSLLDDDVPPDLICPYATLRDTAIVDLGVSPAEVDAWLATWMTDHVPALGGIPSIIIRPTVQPASTLCVQYFYASRQTPILDRCPTDPRRAAVTAKCPQHMRPPTGMRGKGPGKALWTKRGTHSAWSQ